MRHARVTIMTVGGKNQKVSNQDSTVLIRPNKKYERKSNKFRKRKI